MSLNYDTIILQLFDKCRNNISLKRNPFAMSKHGNIELTCNNALSYSLQSTIMLKKLKEQSFCCHLKK